MTWSILPTHIGRLTSCLDLCLFTICSDDVQSFMFHESLILHFLKISLRTSATLFCLYLQAHSILCISWHRCILHFLPPISCAYPCVCSTYSPILPLYFLPQCCIPPHYPQTPDLVCHLVFYQSFALFFSDIGLGPNMHFLHTSRSLSFVVPPWRSRPLSLSFTIS